MFIQNFLYFILSPLSLLPSQGTTENSLTTSSLQVFVHISEVPLSLLQAEQSQLSILLLGQIFQSPKHLHGASPGLAPLCPCLSCTREPSTGPRTPDVAQQCWTQAQDPLLSLVAAQCSVQPKKLLGLHATRAHWWLTFTLLSQPFLFCELLFCECCLFFSADYMDFINLRVTSYSWKFLSLVKH